MANTSKVAGPARIVPLARMHLPTLLALNNRHAAELSLLDAPGLDRLLAAAFHVRIAEADGELAAMLVAFDQSSDYGSPNFLWFRERHRRFVYVDRVAVDGPARGTGLARRLYDDLIARAVAGGYPLVACEVNDEPPNPDSHAFHAAMGFRPVGTQRHAPDKAVRYYERAL